MSKAKAVKKTGKKFALAVMVATAFFLAACGAGSTELVSADFTEAAGETFLQTETPPEESTEKENGPVTAYTVNGVNLSEFTIVAPAEAMEAAKHFAEVLEDKFGQRLPVENVSSFDGGNAIYLGTREISSYGGYRYYLGCEKTDGLCSIYIDGQPEVLPAVTDNVVQKYMKKSSGEAFELPESAYEYCWLDGEFSSGYALKEVTGRKLEEGVTYYELQYGTYALGIVNVYAVVVEPGAKAEAAVWAPPIGGLMDVRAQAEELEAAGEDVIAACNAAFFNMNNGGAVAPYGALIVDGEIMQEPSDDQPKYTHRWFGMTTDGEYVISDLDGYRSTYQGKLQCAVGGSYYLLRDGAVDLPDSSSIAVRTAVAVTADGGFAIICANNASYADLAQIFMDLDINATDALNLDGGGSSVMVVENESRELEIAKVPRDGLREVANCIAVVRTEEN